MNEKVERLPLSANKSNLLRLKEELSFVRDGLELLDEKKEVLMSHISSLSTKADRVRTGVYQALREAYDHLREAVIIHGWMDCERASMAVSMGEDLGIKEKSFMGVALPLVRIKLPEFLPPYGFGQTGASMDLTAKTIREAMDLIGELAEIEVGLFRLVAEIKKTIKRMNALDNVYIPLYETTLRHIEESLEEKEREFLFQLKRQKNRRDETEYETF